MLLLCSEKKIEAFSYKLELSEKAWGRSSLKKINKKGCGQSRWVTDPNPPVASDLLSNISLRPFPLRPRSRWDCGSLRLRPVVHALITDLTCQSGKRKKKTLQSVPIKVFIGLWEILRTVNLGNVKHGGRSAETRSSVIFSALLFLTALNGNMHSILSARVEGQACLLLMLWIRIILSTTSSLITSTPN